MDYNILAEAFCQARLKVKRANRHREEAEALFRQYIESDFCKLTEECDPETGGQNFRVQADPVPAHLVLAIGDAFHNLSAALDYVMTGMMRAAGVSSTRVGFPTNKDRQSLRKAFMLPKWTRKYPPSRKVFETFPSFAMLMLHKIKPYRGGNFLLWEIRKADNIDKHNLIIPSITISQLRGICLLDEEHNNRIENATAIVSAGGKLELMRYNAPGAQMKITNKGQASASLIFAESMEIFAGESVFSTLAQCTQAMGEAIGLIEQHGTKRYIRA